MREKYYWLNEDSVKFLERGYLNEGQSPIERIKEIALAAQSILGIDGFADKFEDYMGKGYYSLSTPVWMNFGNEKGLGISCFNSYIGDSIEQFLEKQSEVGVEKFHIEQSSGREVDYVMELEGVVEKIFEKRGEVGMMTKMGGGTSGYFGAIRPRGSKISTGGIAEGAVRCMDLFDSITNLVSQGSARRGSFAAYLPIDHPDFDEFMRIRSEGHSIQEMSIGVCIPDGWMKETIQGNKENKRRWKEVIKKRAETGYPYLFFSDNANNNKPQVYKDKGYEILSSNLCVAPETMLLTKHGHIPIADLEDEFTEIWNGKRWSSVQVKKTGKNQKLLKVILSDGKELDCTEYHKWYCVESYDKQRRGSYTEKRTFELEAGDKLIKFDCPVIDGEEFFPHPYTHGAFCGDGTYEANGFCRLSLYGEKDCVLDRLVIDKNRGRDESGRLNIILSSEIRPKFEVPLRSSVQTKLDWLAGYLDMDGTIARNGENESIQVVSAERTFLGEVQLLLQTLGVNSKIIDGADEGYKMLPDGKGGSKEYFCRECKRLLITSNGLFKLSLLGFNTSRLKFNHREPQREASHFVRVVSVEDKGRFDDTYCVSEPLEHKAVFNGILTGQCSEIFLPSSPEESFVCCLSSLNLLWWDEIKETDAIETMVMFLDAVMSEFIEKTKDNKLMKCAHEFAKNHRALGMGVLGYHSYLQSKMIAWESLAARFENINIFAEIQKKTDFATKKLAETFGEPEVLKGYGRRNTTTIAIAPTTSSSFILGQVSPSIEPLNSNYFVKNLAKGKFTYKNPYLVKLLQEKNQDTRDIWKNILNHGGSVQQLDFLTEDERDIFKTFAEISQKEILAQAAARQKYIDQGQSINLMLPANTPPKDASQLFVYAWENGIKSLYYQRSSNPSQDLARALFSCKVCEG